MDAYAADVGRTVRLFHHSPSEKDRRRHTAVGRPGGPASSAGLASRA